jgi:hypothetical protein
MTLTLNKNDVFARFVSCARGAGLLKILTQMARRTMDGEASFNFTRRNKFTDDFKPAVKSKNKFNAPRNFSRENSAAKNSNQKTASKKGRF